MSPKSAKVSLSLIRSLLLIQILIPFVFIFLPGCNNGNKIKTKSGTLAISWNTDDGNGYTQLMHSRRPWKLIEPVYETGADSVLEFSNGILYVLSRHEGKVTVIDITSLVVVKVFNLGSEIEPEDLAVLSSDTAFITRRNSSKLLKLDLNDGNTVEIVDLSMFADSDGNPDLGAMAFDNKKLFIQVRRANRDLMPGFEAPAYIAVVDIEKGELVDVDSEKPGIQAIELEGTAPKFNMQILTGLRLLLISASGGGGLFDSGGIEIVDLASLSSIGLFIRESDGKVGADLGAFLMISEERGYLIFSTDLDLSSHLTPFSITGGVKPDSELYVSVGFFIPALAFDPFNHLLFVPDGSDGSRGIHVFNTDADKRLTAEPIEIGGRPTDILFLN